MCFSSSYFLCYEEVPEEPAEGGNAEGKGETVAIGNVVKMWSIGQWVQTQPEPIKDDIYEWYKVTLRSLRNTLSSLTCLKNT